MLAIVWVSAPIFTLMELSERLRIVFTAANVNVIEFPL
jgi:hypothetical protein